MLESVLTIPQVKCPLGSEAQTQKLRGIPVGNYPSDRDLPVGNHIGKTSPNSKKMARANPRPREILRRLAMIFSAFCFRFQFNLLCVGETGMGKTTLIEALFNQKFEFEPCNNELKTVELRTNTRGTSSLRPLSIESQYHFQRSWRAA